MSICEQVNQLGNEIQTETAISDFNVSPGIVGLTPGNPTTRPLFYDNTTGDLQKPNNPMIKLVYVQTPSATGNPVPVIDANGNFFPIAEWTCIVAGFENITGDRSYQCFCTRGIDGIKWYVQYDHASPNQGYVSVLCLSNNFYINTF